MNNMFSKEINLKTHGEVPEQILPAEISTIQARDNWVRYYAPLTKQRRISLRGKKNHDVPIDSIKRLS
jgi:hypothetical protein